MFKTFFILTGYQITWLACVFGQTKLSQPLLGLYIGFIYIILFFYFNKHKIKSLKICLLISIPGYFFDTLMVYFEIYQFNTVHNFIYLPIWMPILWLSFSTLFDEILVFFKKYKLIGIFISGLAGPITYYLGVPIGILTISNTFIFFVFMIVFWVVLMTYYLELIISKY